MHAQWKLGSMCACMITRDLYVVCEDWKIKTLLRIPIRKSLCLTERYMNVFVNYYFDYQRQLLMADVKTARNLLRKTLQGSTLTRRERKQLLRTVSDLFRLVPMSMFLIIPFMEFALPFALKIFPNMLPSTFQDSLKSEENMKRELKSRIAMAEFFQE